MSDPNEQSGRPREPGRLPIRLRMMGDVPPASEKDIADCELYVAAMMLAAAQLETNAQAAFSALVALRGGARAGAAHDVDPSGDMSQRLLILVQDLRAAALTYAEAIGYRKPEAP